jgi:hypothetical protein
MPNQLKTLTTSLSSFGRTKKDLGLCTDIELLPFFALLAFITIMVSSHILVTPIYQAWFTRLINKPQ